MEKIGPGKDYSYGGRLKQFKLPFFPLKPDWPVPSARDLTRIAPRIDVRIGPASHPQQRIRDAIVLWNASHAARFADKQANIVVAGILHFKTPEWQRHTSALIAGIARGDSTLVNPARSVALVQHSSAAREAAELVGKKWRELRLKNIDVLSAAFNKTSNFGPAMSCKALRKLLQFARIPISSDGKYTPQEIACEQARRNIFDAPDEFQEYWSALGKQWAPLENCTARAAWAVLRLMHLKINDPKAFAEGTELSDSPCVARWLTAEIHRKTETGRRSGQSRTDSDS